MKREKHPYIILHDGTFYYVLERLGKDVPFEAYNPRRHHGKGLTVDEALQNATVPVYEVEHHPIEVMFND